jgi:shikimate dehydrogenase
MHNAAFKALGLNAYYLFLDSSPREFQKLLRLKKRLPLSGFNLTVPHKESILPFLDSVSSAVRQVGACNTVIVRKGRWRGENTDVYGFLKSLEEKKFNLREKDALVIGAGGAARAVIFALLSQGARSLVILNRTLSKARKLAEEFSRDYPDCLLGAASLTPENAKTFLAGKHLIVNTTTIGIRKSDPSPVAEKDFPKALFKKRQALVFDLVYPPSHASNGQTELLRVAAKKGYAVQNGLTMLLYQGARAFELWTGRKAPVTVMRKALQNN